MKFDQITKLLLEMPQSNSVKLTIDRTAEEVRSVAEHIDNVTLNNIPFEVWEVSSGDTDLYFLDNDIVAAEVGFYKRKEGIEENLIIQNPKYKGLIRLIYTDYLLTKFRYIISDTSMTNDGLEFWIKLFNQNKKRFTFSIYEISTKINRRVRNEQEMRRVFGQEKKFHNYRFMVQHK